jgi:cytochrome bd-type quinol oxidase subunit 2
MDLSAFFGVVSTVEFALLGLWWVTVQTREDLRRREAQGLGMAYLVSLQFVVPGTASLLAQVAPDLQAVWRVSFAIGGVAGFAAIIALRPVLVASGESGVAKILTFGALPLYTVITVIAVLPNLFGSLNMRLDELQVEAILFCLTIFLSAQTAWAAAMAPERERPVPTERAADRHVLETSPSAAGDGVGDGRHYGGASTE